MLRPERKSSSLAARPSRREVDPFDIVPALVPAAELCCLAERGVLVPSERSPLAAITELAAEFTADSRGRARDSLRRRGLLPGGEVLHTFGNARGRAVYGRDLLRSLTLIARPEGRLRVALRRADRAASVLSLYVAGDEAAVGEVVLLPTGGVALRVGPPVALSALLAMLHDNLSCEAAAGESAVALWPAIVEWLATLWPEAARRGLPSLPRRRALARLTAALGDAARGRAVLEGLLEGAILESPEGRIRLARSYRPWIEAVLSGCGAEVEVSRFGARPEDDVRDHLLFLGPAENRVLCRTVPRPELVAQGLAEGGDHAADEADGCLLLTHLGGELLAARLRQLVLGES